MRRRKLLASTAVGFAGLAEQAVADSTESKPSVTVSKRGEATLPGEDISAHIQIDKSRITHDQTAEIGLFIKNESSELVEMNFVAPNAVNKIQGTSHQGKKNVFLVGKMNNWKPSERRGWVPKPSQINRDMSDRTLNISLGPGHSYRMQYELWSNPGSELYMPEGRHKFVKEYKRGARKSR